MQLAVQGAGERNEKVGAVCLVAVPGQRNGNASNARVVRTVTTTYVLPRVERIGTGEPTITPQHHALSAVHLVHTATLTLTGVITFTCVKP